MAAAAKEACSALLAVLPDKVFAPGSAEYDETIRSYFTVFANSLRPASVVRPSTAEDVAQVIKILERTGAKLAIKGGGHTAWAGSASIDGGVTMDMREFTGVMLSQDEKVVLVGAGERWGNVYKTLEAKNLATAGGRVSRVGVAGLITGGGLSHFSGRTGFACDSVVNFEVVLSTGELVSASPGSNPDLFAALKGGSNNFGVVTRIDLRTFTQGEMWGGITVTPGAAWADYARALCNFVNQSDPDEHAHVLMTLGWAGQHGAEMSVASVYHGKPDDTPTSGSGVPKSLAPFVAAENPLRSSLRRDTLHNFSVEQGSWSVDGGRNLYIGTSVKADEGLAFEIRELFRTAVEPVKDAAGLVLSLVLQPLTAKMLANSAAAGPNALGLAPEDGPLLVVLVNPVWSEAADDERVQAASLQLIEDIDRLAAARGKASRYKYLNYCHGTQDPLAGYGRESLERLRAVAEKYDPTAFFQKSVPGGFKLHKTSVP